MSPAKPSAGKRSAATRPTAAGRQTSHLVVVGIGGSAGGLHAFSTLLEHLPPDTGMAFVIVSHLDPGHPSLLTQLLASKTQMAVAEATDKVRVAPNRVYVAPPATKITIDAGRLRLSPRTAGEHPHLPIDAFLESLAIAQGERAIGVILSGAASDGARGLTAIKAAGGLTFAQEPASAEYPSMPARAIATGVVDFVLAPEKIAVELAAVASHLGAPPPSTPLGASPAQEADALGEIFGLLHAGSGRGLLRLQAPDHPSTGGPSHGSASPQRTSTPTLATCASTRQSCRTSTTTSSSW